MDANNPNKDHRTTPEYAEYQRDQFWKSNEGEVPPFNTGNCQNAISMMETEHEY
jgi:hypothetical protein